MFLLPLLLSFQGGPIQLEKRVPRPIERPSNPPSPSSGPNIVRRGPFASIQVNVDALGGNKKGDAANEPSIAIDPTNPRRIVIGWRQFDTIRSSFRKNGWSYSKDGGKSWAAGATIQSNLFNSDPVLDTDLSGKFYYLSYPGGRSLKVFRSSNGGQSWTGPTNLTGGDKAWMLVDKSNSIGKGNIYVIWQVLHGPNTFMRSTDGGNSFKGPYAVANWPTFGTMAQDSAGNLYAFGLRRQSFGTFVLDKSVNAKDKTKTPTFSSRFVNMGGRMAFAKTPNPQGLLGQAQVVVDPSRRGYVYLLCSVDPFGSDPLDVHFVRSTDGGRTFSAPVRVNDDSRTNGAWQWHGTISVAPTGRIDVVWNDTRNSRGNARLSETFYSYSLDAGKTWSKNVPIGPQWNSSLGWPRQNKIGDYYHALSDKAVMNLAYATTYNGEQDVYFIRIGDCNKNGIHDGVDLRNGTSFDANQNTIPDECEFCQTDLGFGGGTIKLSVCGDDLTKAGSRASLDVQGGPANAPVILLFSAGRLNPPIKFPFGGSIVPDLLRSPSVVFTGFVTNSRGHVGATLKGGSSNLLTLYAQAVQVQGTKILLSNALKIRTGR